MTTSQCDPVKENNTKNTTMYVTTYYYTAFDNKILLQIVILKKNHISLDIPPIKNQ